MDAFEFLARAVCFGCVLCLFLFVGLFFFVCLLQGTSRIASVTGLGVKVQKSFFTAATVVSIQAPKPKLMTCQERRYLQPWATGQVPFESRLCRGSAPIEAVTIISRRHKTVRTPHCTYKDKHESRRHCRQFEQEISASPREQLE